ncbi:MAG: hypothetical protein EXR77_09525 [Myxococcales bacterium]|nr:hypothetical protein [Myxococcales bacterium]
MVQPHDSTGKPVVLPVKIQVVPAGAVAAAGVMECDAKGVCSQAFIAAKSEIAFIKVTVGDKVFKTWPKVTVA